MTNLEKLSERPKRARAYRSASKLREIYEEKREGEREGNKHIERGRTRRRER